MDKNTKITLTVKQLKMLLKESSPSDGGEVDGMADINTLLKQSH